MADTEFEILRESTVAGGSLLQHVSEKDESTMRSCFQTSGTYQLPYPPVQHPPFPSPSALSLLPRPPLSNQEPPHPPAKPLSKFGFSGGTHPHPPQCRPTRAICEVRAQNEVSTEPTEVNYQTKSRHEGKLPTYGETRRRLVMLWGCFAPSGTGEHAEFEG